MSAAATRSASGCRSGTTDLYIAIMATLLVGAAYVPVDADDPEERARLVFGEADVAAVIGTDLAVEPRRTGPARDARGPDSPTTTPG